MTDNRAGVYSNLSYAQERTTAWRVNDRGQSGMFLETLDGTKIARLGNNSLLFWDKRYHAEVEISLDALARLCAR